MTVQFQFDFTLPQNVVLITVRLQFDFTLPLGGSIVFGQGGRAQ